MFTRLVIIVVVVLSSSFVSAGQSVNASTLAGKVTDQTGAVIVGATVAIESAAARSRQTTETDGQGRYTFDLAPGTYSVTVNASGFLPFGASVDIRRERPKTLDVSMKIGISV